MKRTLLLLAAAALALSLLVSAPAFSLRPYQPAPVDFELAPAASGLHASSSGAVTSAPLRAPRRFDVLGLRWSGSAEPHVRLRVRRTGGSWSPWRTLDAHPDHGPDAGTGEHTRGGVVTDAAWAGHSDYVQYRLSRRVPGLRIHFVNTTGSATAADRARTSVRRFVSRGLVTAARLLPARAHAAEAQPAMVARADWGAADCPPRAAPSYGEVRAIFVHHTVTLNDYTPEEAKAAVLGICRYHRNSNGWNDIGYNFLVDKYGTLYEGRAGGVDRAVLGAHTQGFNGQATAVSNIGDYTSVPQTQAALDAMARLIRWKLPLHGQPTAGNVTLTSAGGSTNRWSAGTPVSLNRISGHRDGNNTACPGNALYAQLPALRSLVGNVQPSPEASSRTSLVAAPAPAVVVVPRPTRMNGTLIAGDGAPVSGAPVEIQRLVNRAWKRVAGATTNSDGAFSVPVSATKRQVLRARFPGDGTLRASASRASVVLARPRLVLAAPLGTMGVKRAFRLRGSIAPSKPRVVIVLLKKKGRRYGKPSYIRVAPRKGAFSLRLRLKKAGRYRAYARFVGDDLNVQSNSRAISFVVAKRARSGAPPPASPGGGVSAKR